MSSALTLLAALKPAVVITAPDGQQLWIDATPDSSGADTGGPSLWPNGFKVSVKVGGIPQADPKVTASPTEFFTAQSPTLLAAPGPLALPWWVWLLGAVTLALVPFLPLLWRKKW